MKGDFSEWKLKPLNNLTGVLHQQGRVSLDQDGNAANMIASYLRQMQGRDAIGPHVAAVPAEEKDSFKISKAHTNGSVVFITSDPGRVWVDGWLLKSQNSNPEERTVEYFAPPIQDPQAKALEIKKKNVRDAVVLEVWEEALNGFQDPDNLIEPALGGVDTIQRAKLFYDIKLLRLVKGDECGNLVDKLADKFGSKGKLTVTPAPTLAIAGDCPVELGGGYTGFEHYLFRIEIAEPAPTGSPDAGKARFKWSRFNGGLVGRGTCSSITGNKGTVTITANDQMISHCGLNSFYIEALAEGTHGGRWTVGLSADATLASDGTLALTDVKGTWPGDANGEAFFRLWDGKALITDFPIGLPTPNELVTGLGIRLEFDMPLAGNSNYTPGDFWTFPVRTSGTEDFDPATEWPSNDPPEGIHYHRVPLAILNWNGAPSAAAPITITAPDNIHDCRRIFQPLAKLDNCCQYTVGDGMRSFGDYDSIQAAIKDLPLKGGRICVLPGEFNENILIEKDNVIILGCGPDSHITAPSKKPAVHIRKAANVTLHGLRITAHQNGAGIHLEEHAPGQGPQHIVLKELIVNAATRSAVEMDAGRFFSLQNSHILMDDVASPWPGVYITGDDVLVEHNVIAVKPKSVRGDVVTVSAGRGGIQLGGGSERVQIIDNLIQGGIGNGITLGTVEEIDDSGVPVSGVIAWVVNAFDPCDPCAPGSVYYPPGGGNGGPTYRSAGTLYEVRIERNRIFDMGLNGIGVVMFFNLNTEDEFISVEGLDILGNSIRRCLTRSLELIPDEMIDSMGYGGISLADVENLVVHDNVIEENGPDHLFPICGIFVLHGEGIDISRNRILNNGAKTYQPSTSANPGRRSGINIVFGIAPQVAALFRDNTGGALYPRQNGVPSTKIHDNIVSQPLGQALSLTALGPVYIEGNQFTSRGVVANRRTFTFKPAVVEILNLGMSNELYLQSYGFSGETATVSSKVGPITFEEGDVVIPPQPGMDDRNLGQYLANGNVMFTDNQCLLDLMEIGYTLSLVSVAILSLDDVAFQNNQCDCNLLDDFLLTHTAFVGLSLRVSDNRFKEGIQNALFSAITLGLFLSMTTNNQATHCLVPLPSPLASLPSTSPKILNSPNQIMAEVFVEDFCEAFGKYFDTTPVYVARTHATIG